MDRVIEITAKNGNRYKFVEWTLFRTLVETYCWFGNKWNRIGKSFETFDDAVNWVAELDKQYANTDCTPKFISSLMPQSAYYSITGYYGD